MKKLLLSIAFLATSVTAFSQTVPLTQDWVLRRGESPLITSHTTTGNSSVAYNKVTDHIYLVDRNNKISILKTDGTVASPSELATKPEWSTDSYKYTKIRVTDDGVIYAINTRLTAGDLQIYRWASETDTDPSRTEIAVPTRSGESFAVYGTGDNTRLYTSGANGTAVTVAKVTGGVITKEFDIPVSVNHARGSISIESNGAAWINTPNSGAGFETRRINFDSTTGAVTSTDIIPGLKIDWTFANTEYFKGTNRKFLAVSGAVIGSSPSATNMGIKMRIYEITSGFATPVLISEGDMFPYASATPGPPSQVTSSNPNGYGDVAIKANLDGTFTFFHVVFGNGLTSYTTSAATPLPVSMTSFAGALVNGQSTLTWSTASESGNKGFDVLRSTDGATFTDLGFVAAKSTNGNSATAINYTYVDRSAKAGVNYYQLKQVDLNGTSELFDKVVSVNVTLSNAVVTVYPNPAASYVNVSTGGADFNGYQYDLFDVNGKKVMSAKATSGEQQISLSGLAPSIYYLKVSKDNVSQNTIKLIKK